MVVQGVAKARTGVVGLDDVLGGGLAPGHVFLLEGHPGTGKTTVALQFLREGAANGERVLYVTLSETEAELHSVAASHGWSLGGIEVREMLPSDDALVPDQQNTMFHSSEVELVEAVVRLAGDPALCQRLGAAGRTRLAARFDVERLAGEYLEFLEGVAR